MSMEEMWDVANTISVIAGLFISGILVIKFYNSYVSKKINAYIIGCVFFVSMSVLYLIPFTMSGDIAYLIGAVIVCVVSVLLDRRNVAQKMVLAVTLYMFLWVSNVISALFWQLISTATYMKVQDDLDKQFVLFVVALLLFVLLKNVFLLLEMLLFKKVYTVKDDCIEWKELPLILSPYAAIIVGYLICSFLADAYADALGEYVWNNYPVYDLIRAVFGVMAFLASVTVIYSYRQLKISQERALQNALVSKQIEELTEHVHTIENLYSDIRGIRHDINNHIMVLGNLLEKGENAEAMSYLNEWQSGFPVPDISVKTGNPVTDIVISEKSSEARALGIEFTSQFKYPIDGNVESVDIGVILNNALSNALRAASDSDNPKARISSYKNNNTFLIKVTNSFSGKIIINPDTGFPVTSKKDAKSHGYGIINMKRIAEKYYGTIKLEQDGNEVIFSAMMMI